MTRPCTVCAHPHRETIDKALINGAPSYRELSEQYELSTTSISRHRAEHIPAHLLKAQEVEEIARADDLVAEVRAYKKRIDDIINVVTQDSKRRKPNYMVALRAFGQLRAFIELQAKLLGQIDERPQVNVLVSPEWAAIRVVLMRALEPYPDARYAVAEALRQLDAS